LVETLEADVSDGSSDGGAEFEPFDDWFAFPAGARVMSKRIEDQTDVSLTILIQGNPVDWLNDVRAGLTRAGFEGIETPTPTAFGFLKDDFLVTGALQPWGESTSILVLMRRQLPSQPQYGR
jgi:hypothetical protein